NPSAMNSRNENVTAENEIPVDAPCASAKWRVALPMPRPPRVHIAALIFILTILAATAHAADCAAQVLAEMNLARSQPQAYAQIVAQTARPGREGDRAIQEAVRFLQKAKPLP